MNKSLSVIPSGGVLSINVAMDNGLIRITEIVLQLTGKEENDKILTQILDSLMEGMQYVHKEIKF